MKVTFSGFDQLAKAGKRLASTVDASRVAGYRAANVTGKKVITDTKRDIASQLNLTQRDIAAVMSLNQATPAKSVSVVKVRKTPIRLARYSARQLTTPAKRAKGDAMRGIPPGRKQAGVSVKVARGGARKKMKGAFLVPLRGGTVSGGNGMGVFFRQGKEIIHVYGPSQYQLFRRLVAEGKGNIQKILRASYESELRYALKGRRT